MKIKTAVQRPDDLINAMLEVWEASVRATHDFLNEKHIQELVPFVMSGLKDISQLLYVSNDNGQLQGFMGIENAKIEMLFIHPEARGTGLGKIFITHAFEKMQAFSVDVNEQNTQGVGFYQHMGFRIFQRSELDSQGNPFPILHMKKGSEVTVPVGYTICLAQPEHLSHLNNIELAAATIFPPGFLPEHILSDKVPLKTLETARQEGRLWVAFKKNRLPVGYTLLEITDSFALLAQIDVLPEHGGKGIGKALIKRICAQLKDLNISELYLTTFSHIPWNAPFYEKLGFRILKDKEQPLFIKDILTEEKNNGLNNRVAMLLRLSE